MGSWGFGIFQSDHDLDHAAQVSEEVGLELYAPEDPDAARAKLDDGLLSKTFERYLAEDEQQTFSIVILGALAMQLGVKIDGKYMNVLRGLYKTCELYPLGQKQMKKALDAYPNDGTPWDFESPGLHETMMAAANSSNGKPNRFGMIGMNVASPLTDSGRGGFPREIKPPTATRSGSDTDDHGKPRCWSCTETRDNLLHCARCRKALYCNSTCQKADWKEHKKLCAEIAKAGKSDQEGKENVKGSAEDLGMSGT